MAKPPPSYPPPSRQPPSYPPAGRPPTPPVAAKPPPPRPPADPGAAARRDRLFRILWVVASAGIAHVVASYVCLMFTLHHMNNVMSQHPTKQMFVPRSYQLFAPARIFRIISGWRESGHDTSGGITYLWLCYAVPLVLAFIGMLVLPRFLFIDDEDRAAAAAGGAARR
ncbi:MAG TPA: hypothetical protein VER17_19025 [Tepidisphaeraceae bacterium]|nr:hypothetical protein [Tepidisphaeraceae bacterium]